MDDFIEVEIEVGVMLTKEHVDSKIHVKVDANLRVLIKEDRVQNIVLVDKV